MNKQEILKKLFKDCEEQRWVSAVQTVKDVGTLKHWIFERLEDGMDYEQAKKIWDEENVHLACELNPDIERLPDGTYQIKQ